MSKIPIIDPICNWVSDQYVDVFYFTSHEIITKRKIIEIQKKQILASNEDGDRNCGGVLLDQYTLDDILDLWYNWVKQPDCYIFAAYMLHSIASKHPFIQGNKRTAFMTATLILGCCGKTLEVDNSEIVKFMKEVAEGKHELEMVIKWIRANTVEEDGIKKLVMIFEKFGSELVEIENNKKAESGLT